ncbi:MAG: isoprenylcysteine carboxylmethyltransferase family protein [Acidobacteriia bacterium]|jgi:protein-S-isoprenylcysteine O-methyltransferase Ste14|nr:isoprenylcysteine carboxylmethyltransferase family protein [Terriglobia bacterium]
MDKGYAAWAARWRVPLGFALGVGYLIFSRPTMRLVAAGGTIALAGLIQRAYAAGCLEKNRALATCGPYAHTRNPLYLGSLVMGAGFAVAGGSWILGTAFLALFLLVYWPVMRREEASLRLQFGDAYEKYAVAVPFFFPSLRRATRTSGGFRWELYRKNREYQAAAGFGGGIAFLVLKMLLG